ncbi:peptidoglycan DD-metalloendopeptidase family protein [Dactylosporangium sp. NPDC000244]|uniref:peptidoglycan DD-metalloendopeptidase family protein n=1 Tax=Dactylosporangium sp. NPDC000244 TaxID=3154365 RepID=UPI00332A9888
MNRIRIVAAFGVVLMLLGPGSVAHADTGDDKARLDKQLQETQATLEAATDKAQQAAADHDRAQAALPGAQQSLADAKGRVIAADAAVRQAERDRTDADAAAQVADAGYAEAKRQVDKARQDVSVFVSAAYKGGGFAMVNSVLDSGGPTDLALRIEYLNHVAEENQAAVDELTAARMDAKKRSDTALLALRRAQDAADAAQRSLTESQAAQAGAERAAADVQQLLDTSAAAEATANAERGAVLARYEALKVESDKVAEQLRAEAQAEARKAKQGSGGAKGNNAPPNTVIGPKTGAFFLMPVHGWKSSNFGMRFDPVYKVYQLHAGVDIAAGGGQPIVAAADGVVVRAGPSGGNGNYTCISHGLYQGKGLATCYAHQSAILVHVGERVSRGELIGRVGTTGASTGYHLHFEVRLNGSPVQPLTWLPGCLC